MPDNSGECQRREVRVQCRVLSAFLFICLFIFLLFLLLLLLSLLFLLLLSEIRLLSAAPVTRRMGPVVYQRCAAAASGTNVKPTGPHKGNSASAFKVGRARSKLSSFVSLSFLNLLFFLVQSQLRRLAQLVPGPIYRLNGTRKLVALERVPFIRSLGFWPGLHFHSWTD